MMTQKQYKDILREYKNNNMVGFSVWFQKNINGKYLWNKNTLIPVIKLYSNSKNHIVFAIENGYILKGNSKSFFELNNVHNDNNNDDD